MYAMMDQSREGQEIMSVMMKSAYDIVMEYFEDERVRLHFLRMVSENLTGPEEKGTGIGPFMFLGWLEKYGIGVAKGGSGMLSQSLVDCIKDHGGEVITNTSISKVLVSDGRAVGVVTDDGREIKAKDAVSVPFIRTCCQKWWMAWILLWPKQPQTSSCLPTVCSLFMPHWMSLCSSLLAIM